MPIAVFDIDGTLTNTMDVDVECYESAILELLSVQIPADWPSLVEITDPAILESACERHGHPVPDASTEDRIAARVAELLSIALNRSPDRFQPIPGARNVFDAVRAAGWRVAMATGAWRPSALVKLAGAAIPTEGVPLATASDHRARRDIIRQAVSALDPVESERVIYVGDGIWDGRAATSLGYGFVGVGPKENEQALHGAGATGVVPDFSDASHLLSELDRSGVSTHPDG